MGEVATRCGGDSLACSVQRWSEVQASSGAGRVMRMGGALIWPPTGALVAGGRTGRPKTGRGDTALVALPVTAGVSASWRGVVAQPANSRMREQKISSAGLNTRQLCGRKTGTQVDSGQKDFPPRRPGRLKPSISCGEMTSPVSGHWPALQRACI